MQISNDPVLFWIGLNSIPGVGRATFRKLAQHFGSPEQALAASARELQAAGGMSEAVVREITGGSWRAFAEQELLKARNAGVTILTADNPAYPACLLDTPDPPLFLYIKGTLKQDEDGIAIVGTRKPSHYGFTLTHRLALQLSEAGFTIVSGLARGIDTQAHKGALTARGRTIAVLACGIDIVYPPENRGLLEQIARNGAVISENPFGTKPESGYFPGRNRIISGLSRGTVIVEAAEDSGSLITARYTLEQERKLFAIPGNIGSPTSKGTNSLIKDGALLVENAEDVVRGLGFGKRVAQNKAPLLPLLSTEEETVLCRITDEPKHIDVIMNESGTTVGPLNAFLLSLELKGLVKQLPGKYYVREV